MAVNRREWTVVAMLEWATDYLKKQGVPDPRYSIEWLLADVLGMKRLDLYLYYDRPLSEKERDALRPLFKRRANHEPLQYIIGHTDFLDARLEVTPDVLIPRMETEQLVEYILEDSPSNRPLSVLDIGTGSGCIAIALKMKRDAWNINAIDISTKALDIAKKNAKKNDTEINFLQLDILNNDLSTLPSSFDLIVSNPPYVLHEEKDELEPQVAEYEPEQALFCDDIETMYQRIIGQADAALKKDGSLYLEIHARQKEIILNQFDTRRWEVELLADYGKTERFIHAKR